jgi:hypothetical protein
MMRAGSWRTGTAVDIAPINVSVATPHFWKRFRNAANAARAISSQMAPGSRDGLKPFAGGLAARNGSLLTMWDAWHRKV